MRRPWKDGILGTVWKPGTVDLREGKEYNQNMLHEKVLIKILQST